MCCLILCVCVYSVVDCDPREEVRQITQCCVYDSTENTHVEQFNQSFPPNIRALVSVCDLVSSLRNSSVTLQDLIARIKTCVICWEKQFVEQSVSEEDVVCVLLSEVTVFFFFFFSHYIYLKQEQPILCLFENSIFIEIPSSGRHNNSNKKH